MILIATFAPSINFIVVLIMNNSDFWASIQAIIDTGFTPEGLIKLDRYAEQFISGQLVYKRFSPLEQHGCATGGVSHVIASLISGAKIGTSQNAANTRSFQDDFQCATEQEACIERWARAVGLWMESVDESLRNTFGDEIAEGGEAKVYDHGSTLIKSIGLDYFILPILALDRISLHNAYFPETALTVIGFGRTSSGSFKIIVEQPFVSGFRMTDEEISLFMSNMGFSLRNARNWTYATPEIYLSDMHDENVIKSATGTVFVIDCDIRINTPSLRQGGIRKLSTEVVFL